MFVRACVKLLMSCASRYKILLSKRELAFRAAIHKLLSDAEAVVLASMCVCVCVFCQKCLYYVIIKFSFFHNGLLAFKVLEINAYSNFLLQIYSSPLPTAILPATDIKYLWFSICILF
jgi:hypothetical protein